MVSHDLTDIVRPLERIPDLRKFTLSVVPNRKTAAHLDERESLVLRADIGMYTESVRRRPIGEAERYAGPQARECILQPGWRCRTGILYRRGKGRVLERTLRFTVVVEAELVHGCVADGPGMGNVPLLKALVGDGAETGHIRAGGLKL